MTILTAAGPSKIRRLSIPIPDEPLLHRGNISRKTKLELVSGSCYLPKKDEGEDDHFICEKEQVIGVADGVGGWAKSGINAGLYARELMSNSVIAVQNQTKGYVDPTTVLREAYSNTKAKGSSTACIIALKDECLDAINVGDSGFMVIRKESVVYHSPVQQRYFNCPYQLGNAPNSDNPSSAMELKVSIEPGDIIVAGTDGLFDNLFEENIVEDVIEATKYFGKDPEEVAWIVAEHAYNSSCQKQYETPFSIEAEKAGYKYLGGKIDDITVVVAYVVPSNF